VRVEIELKRHEFAFGSAVSAKALMAPGPDGDRYRALVEELFNTVTLENDLKWGPWEAPAEDPNFSQAQTFAALRWLRIDYEVTVKYLPQRHLIESCQSLGEVYLRLGRFSEALTYQVRHHHSRITPTCIRSSGLFNRRLRVELDNLRFGFDI
jgi:hypothetical protein